MRFCFVRLIEGVAFGELPLVMIELGLLLISQDRVFVGWAVRVAAGDESPSQHLWDPRSDSSSETAGHSPSN